MLSILKIRFGIKCTFQFSHWEIFWNKLFSNRDTTFYLFCDIIIKLTEMLYLLKRKNFQHHWLKLSIRIENHDRWSLALNISRGNYGIVPWFTEENEVMGICRKFRDFINQRDNIQPCLTKKILDLY